MQIAQTVIKMDTIETVYVNEYIYLSIFKDSWYICATNGAKFYLLNQDYSTYLPLSHQGLYAYSIHDSLFVVYVEYLDNESSIFHNYVPLIGNQIVIGKNMNSDIVSTNKAISSKHAVLSYSGTSWHIVDCNSRNGVFLNNKRVHEAELKIGDMIYIVGLQIIIGSDFISVNDEKDSIYVNPNSLRKKKQYVSEKTGSEHAEELFSRSPRKRALLPKKEIYVEGPPMSLNNNQIPLLLRMGGSAVMSGASALTGNFLPLVSTMVFPMITSRYTDKQKQEYENRRTEKYREYLTFKKQEIDAELRSEKKFWMERYPSLSDIIEYAHRTEHLWERRPSDSDYLKVRVGRGNLQMHAEIKYPEQRFSMDEDELEKQMYELAAAKYYLDNVPIVLSFRENIVVGYQGSTSRILRHLQNIIIQMAILHSYDEVKFVFMTDPETLACFDWIRFLPHVWNNQRDMRFIAFEQSDAYQIMEYIKDQIAEEKDQTAKISKGNPKGRPWYVIFATNKKLLEGSEFLAEIMQNEDSKGISVIAAYDMPPKDSSVIIDMNDKNGKLIYLNDQNEKDKVFIEDSSMDDAVRKSMKTLSNVFLKELNDSFNLPTSVTFLEMLNVGKIEQLQIQKRWRESDPTASLAVPLGIGVDGEHINLDLHEKFHGPHGLVAGTTGSGKSELLLTYILSMALNYHPDEVAFVLIDYKGGGLAGAFVDPAREIHLPHVIGTITNLDGSAISRSLISIQSELLRRQAVFNEAKSIANEGTMDIYRYQKLYRKGIVSKPVPHLIIISDEFAELKAQQPEFMDQIISIARIGRSLGVHLILATQKPAGIVTDQIRSNSKFQICMKVQDRSDSVDMLQRPDAIQIKETGRFFLQVGNNELFVMGQSGWSGAPYIPSEKVTKNKNETISFIDATGQVIYKGKTKVKKDDSAKSQLLSVVKSIQGIANSVNFERKDLWQPMLPTVIPLSADHAFHKEKTNKILLNIGMYDNPENQEQSIYELNLSDSNHVLIAGEVGSGKSSLVQTILLQAVREYKPSQFQYYVFDFAGNRYREFAKLPHCGECIPEQEEEKIGSCFELIEEIIQERKTLFQTLEVANYSEAVESTEVPLITVVIDDVIGFASTESGNAYYDKIQEYLKHSQGLGIVFVLVTTKLEDVLYRVRQEIGTKIALHQKSRYEYGEVLDCICKYEPPNTPGRGMALIHEKPMEVHMFAFAPELSLKEQNQILSQEFIELTDRYGGDVTPKKISIIEKVDLDSITYEQFASQFEPGKIPLGYDLDSSDMKGVALPLKQAKQLSIYFGSSISKVPIIENLLFAASRDDMKVIVFKKESDSVFDLKSKVHVAEHILENLQTEDGTVESLIKVGEELKNEIAENRSPLYKQFKSQPGINLKGSRADRDALYHFMKEKTQTIVIFFESLPEVVSVIDDDTYHTYYQGYLQYAERLNFMFLCGFHPGDNEECKKKLMLKEYVFAGHIILFGGSYDDQFLLNFSSDEDDEESSDDIPYDHGLIYYRRKGHTFRMPMNLPEPEAIDPDDEDIFK